MMLVKEEFDRLHADLLPLTNSEVRRVFDGQLLYFLESSAPPFAFLME